MASSRNAGWFGSRETALTVTLRRDTARSPGVRHKPRRHGLDDDPHSHDLKRLMDMPMSVDRGDHPSCNSDNLSDNPLAGRDERLHLLASSGSFVLLR